MRIGAGTRRAFGVALLVMLTAAPSIVLQPAASLAQSTPLRVIVDGELVPLQGNAIVQNGVVMAPFQGLADPLGARAAWDPRTETLTLIGAAGDEMQLRPNDPYATVNGERRPIPIPLVTVFGRVLIPVQWVFDTLGDITSYDAATQTLSISAQITGVTWQAAGGGLAVELDGTAPLHARAIELSGPDRIVIDVDRAVAKLVQPDPRRPRGTALDRGGRDLAAGTQIVLTLTEPVPYEFRGDAGRPPRGLTLLPHRGAGAGRSDRARRGQNHQRGLPAGGRRGTAPGRQHRPRAVQPARAQESDRIVLDAANADLHPGEDRRSM